MHQRTFDPTLRVPEIGLGCWQLGGTWGTTPAEDGAAQAILDAAYTMGTRFFDTADVYGDGRSERRLGEFRRRRPDITIATKLGRRGIFPDGHTRDSLRSATLRSLELLGVERLDFTQLHCIPTAVLARGEVFAWLEEQRRDGLISRWGASVESVEEGLLCLKQPGCSSLQIIFNLFRQKPAWELLPAAAAKGVAIIVRLPLASGLLSGRFSANTIFAVDDHRHFNRDGAAFNVGETFAGLPFADGVRLAQDLFASGLLPAGDPAGLAIRWILDHPQVTVVIPGASRPEQATANAAAAELPPLSPEVHARLDAWYRQAVHPLVRGPY